MKKRILLASLLLGTLASLAALAIQSARVKAPAAPLSLTAYIPQDALLSIECPDFASLLHRWESSAESKAWQSSDQHSVFANSRLFQRLSDAQSAYAEAAGLPPDTALLNQVAGTQSVFAWYDIGNLEFLYISRMPLAQSAQTQLLQSRSSFQRRHAGNVDFYVRTVSTHPARTVAFAQVPGPSGDLLLLATREDLIANALVLIANGKGSSLQQEPWFSDASSALQQEKSSPALHMVLNLDRIVPTPYFRSYWVQANITWMKQYRAAASDLYLEPGLFREERVLLPKASPAATSSSPNVAALASIVPVGTGVFRAVATDDPAQAIAAINTKLLGIYTPEKTRDLLAEDPDLTVPQAGSAGDLETRIDTPAPVSEAASNEALGLVVAAARLDAMLTVSSAASPASASALWVPIHSAIALHGQGPWNPQTLASALQQSLRGSLTAATLGIDFKASQDSGITVYSLTGPRPLFFAVAAQSNLVVLSDDRSLLLSLLNHPAPSTTPHADDATLIAGFDHTGQRIPYARLTSLIDGTNNPAGKPIVRVQATTPSATVVSGAPTFFSQEIRSLSDSFASLQSERIVERSSGGNLRQTVTYHWNTQ